MKIKKQDKLEKSIGNRGHLVKVSKQIQGKTGAYQSHRWVNPNKALELLKQSVKGVRTTDTISFKEKKSGKTISEKELLNRFQREGKKQTIQEYVQSKYSINNPRANTKAKPRNYTNKETITSKQNLNSDKMTKKEANEMVISSIPDITPTDTAEKLEFGAEYNGFRKYIIGMLQDTGRYVQETDDGEISRKEMNERLQPVKDIINILISTDLAFWKDLHIKMFKQEISKPDEIIKYYEQHKKVDAISKLSIESIKQLGIEPKELSLNINEKGELELDNKNRYNTWIAEIKGLDAHYGFYRKFLDKKGYSKKTYQFSIKEGSIYNAQEVKKNMFFIIENGVGYELTKDEVTEILNKQLDEIPDNRVPLDLPTLTGSEKQVEWANHIRLGIIRSFNGKVDEVDIESISKMVSAKNWTNLPEIIELADIYEEWKDERKANPKSDYVKELKNRQIEIRNTMADKLNEDVKDNLKRAFNEFINETTESTEWINNKVYMAASISLGFLGDYGKNPQFIEELEKYLPKIFEEKYTKEPEPIKPSVPEKSEEEKEIARNASIFKQMQSIKQDSIIKRVKRFDAVKTIQEYQQVVQSITELPRNEFASAAMDLAGLDITLFEGYSQAAYGIAQYRVEHDKVIPMGIGLLSTDSRSEPQKQSTIHHEIFHQLVAKTQADHRITQNKKAKTVEEAMVELAALSVSEQSGHSLKNNNMIPSYLSYLIHYMPVMKQAIPELNHCNNTSDFGKVIAQAIYSGDKDFIDRLVSATTTESKGFNILKYAKDNKYISDNVQEMNHILGKHEGKATQVVANSNGDIAGMAALISALKAGNISMSQALVSPMTNQVALILLACIMDEEGIEEFTNSKIQEPEQIGFF